MQILKNKTDQHRPGERLRHGPAPAGGHRQRAGRRRGAARGAPRAEVGRDRGGAKQWIESMNRTMNALYNTL